MDVVDALVVASLVILTLTAWVAMAVFSIWAQKSLQQARAFAKQAAEDLASFERELEDEAHELDELDQEVAEELAHRPVDQEARATAKQLAEDSASWEHKLDELKHQLDLLDAEGQVDQEELQRVKAAIQELITAAATLEETGTGRAAS